MVSLCDKHPLMVNLEVVLLIPLHSIRAYNYRLNRVREGEGLDDVCGCRAEILHPGTQIIYNG
jgi:hypothetical protein